MNGMGYSCILFSEPLKFSLFPWDGQAYFLIVQARDHKECGGVGGEWMMMMKKKMMKMFDDDDDDDDDDDV